MENYTYNREIRTAILHFMSAIDGAVVKRYDKNLEVKDEIKVNYLYAPKERVLYDLIDKAEHVKLPVVAVQMQSIVRDPQRVKENLYGRMDDLLEYNKGSVRNIPTPVPVNITFNLTILTKYQQDMEQVLTNFIPYSDPYIVVSWREPFTGYELESAVNWDGNITLNYPDDRTAKDQYQHLEATTTFVYKGYIFKNAAEEVGKICKIKTDYVLTDQFYCDYDQLVEETKDNTRETFILSGAPLTQWADPVALKTGDYIYGCGFPVGTGLSGAELIGATEEMSVQGWFLDPTDVFLSADSPDMFVGQTMSSIDIFEGNANYPPFNGIVIDKFTLTHEPIDTLTFSVPQLSGSGCIDVIVVNPCGYSKLTEDRRTIESCCENPYNMGHTYYDAWEALQDPFACGVEVIQTDLLCIPSVSGLSGLGLKVMGTIPGYPNIPSGKAIKTLGDFYILEV